MQITSFEELPLNQALQQAVADMGFVTPSPIQTQTIPLLLEGKDVIGQAQTGTGKTAAFALPILQRLDVGNKKPQALILCPTRELAVQVAEEFKKLAKHMEGVYILSIFGGDSMERQIMLLRKGVHIVVGTPGRVQDHIRRATLTLDQIRVAVLDEADEMLNMGFVEEIEQVLQMLPEDKQTVFFSATMPAPILALTRRFQRDPHLVKVVRDELTNISIQQFHYVVQEIDKLELMVRLVEMHQLKLMLAFCNTKQRVDELVSALQDRGISAEGLHGDMNQPLRNAVMSRYRRGVIAILVATDVAARGIDVQDVDGVFNYDAPLDPEYYVHRIGRTGRAGKTGTSFTFVLPREITRLRMIERFTKVNIPKGEIPSIAQLIGKRNQNLKKDLLTLLGTKTIAPSTVDLLDELVKINGDIQTVAAALLQAQIENMEPQNQFDESRHFESHYYADRPKYGNSGSGSNFSGKRSQMPPRGERKSSYGNNSSSSSYNNGKKSSESAYGNFGKYGDFYKGKKDQKSYQQNTPRDLQRKRKP